MRPGLDHPRETSSRRTTDGRAGGMRGLAAAVAAFLVVGTTVVAGSSLAVAVETGAVDSTQAGTVIRTPSGQEMWLENVATPLPGISPLVGNQVVGAPSSTAGRSGQFTPAMTSSTSFIDVLTSGDVTNRVDYAALGLPINPQTAADGIAEVLSFDIVLGTPMADPRFQVAVNGPKAATVIDGTTYIIASFGPRVTVSDARDASGDPVAISGVSRLSGFQDAQPVASGAGWLANSFLWSPAGNSGFLFGAIPWLTASDPDQVALDGSLQVQTGGQPVSRVTVTLDSRFFRDAAQGATDGHLPNISVAVVVPTQVSALPRLLPGTDYGHASHVMPVIGTDNLHLGATIVESQPNVITTELNSGTPTDNSDAGYDGLSSFYLCDDTGQTPVTTVGPGQAGQTLCTTVPVSGARTERAYVSGYVDFTRAGNFDDAAAASTEVSAPVLSGTGDVTLQWTVPDDVAPGDLPVRLRTSYDPAGTAPSGPATTGEVEDYTGRLAGEDRDALSLTKVNDLPAGTTVTVGDSFDYTLTLTNADTSQQTGVVVSDDLPAGLEYVTAGADPRWDFGSSTSATAVVDVPASSSVQLPLSVQVASGATGELRNIAVVDDQDPATCVATPTPHCGVDAAAPTATAAPTLSGTPTAGVVGSVYDFAFVLGGDPAPTVAVTAGALPDGLVLDAGTGVISGTPTVPGVFSFTVTASNGTAPDAVLATSITVTQAPTVSGAPTAGVVGSAYSFGFVLGGDPAPTVAVTAGALPDGLSIDADTGVITGTPTAPGVFLFTVTATNGTAPDAVLATSISVVQAPTVSGAPSDGVVGSVYSFGFTLGGDPAPTVAVTAGALPDGLVLDADTGVITGTPTVTGVFSFTVTASNGTAPDAVLATSITVTQAPTVSGIPPVGVVGSAYSFGFTLAGDPAPTVAVTVGALPDGLVLDGDTGEISGTPTVPGVFLFTVTASNGTAPDAVLATSISVVQAPTVSGAPPVGVVGSAYSFGFTLGGSPAPTVAVTAGALPDGLSLDADTGVITGTPTVAGVFSFTVTATNGISPDAAVEVTIVITDAVAGVPVIELEHAVRTPGQEQTVTGTGFVAGEDVAFVLTSDPVDLGGAVADADGSVVLRFVVPLTTAPGLHTVTATGAEGEARATFTVVVPTPEVPTPEPTTPEPTTPVAPAPVPTSAPGTGEGAQPEDVDNDGLASTGAAAGPWAAGAAVLLTAGVVLLLGRRRRES